MHRSVYSIVTFNGNIGQGNKSQGGQDWWITRFHTWESVLKFCGYYSKQALSSGWGSHISSCYSEDALGASRCVVLMAVLKAYPIWKVKWSQRVCTKFLTGEYNMLNDTVITRTHVMATMKCAAWGGVGCLLLFVWGGCFLFKQEWCVEGSWSYPLRNAPNGLGLSPSPLWIKVC